MLNEALSYTNVQPNPTRFADIESRLVPATCESLDEMEQQITRDVVAESIIEDAQPMPISFAGRTLYLRPVDRRRFVMAMQKHICLN